MNKVINEMLANMSAQEVFDKVYNHLINQGRASVDEYGFCRYRHNGLMCAAGCLIPDEEYSQKLEMMHWTSLGLSNHHLELIQTMQSIHDRSNNPNLNFADYVNTKFKELAEVENLNFLERE